MEDSLESILGYTFSNRALLAESLTHASYAYAQPRPTKDNQRLEFLGDAVLQLVLSDTLFHHLQDTDEGGLTKLRAALVSAKALAKLARSIDLGRFLSMARGEELNGGRDRDSTLADALEAVLGAAFLDGGLNVARDIVLKLMGDLVSPKAQHEEEQVNPKGVLQELTQDVTNLLPIYQILGATGPDHDKTYQATVSWHDQLLGTGSGRSKKDAEIEAARAAIRNPLLHDLVRQAKLSPELSPSAAQTAPNNCAEH